MRQGHHHFRHQLVFQTCGKGYRRIQLSQRHPAEFRREFISADETAETLREIIRLCNTTEGVRPKEFIFTVSPIRHFKDGAHGNQLSKGALLLGTDSVLRECDCSCGHAADFSGKADYFPAYEIMMDELRDYRFYAEDMCHPSQQAVNYIRERFLSWALPASEHTRLEENIREFRHRSHIVKD